MTVIDYVMNFIAAFVVFGVIFIISFAPVIDLYLNNRKQGKNVKRDSKSEDKEE